MTSTKLKLVPTGNQLNIQFDHHDRPVTGREDQTILDLARHNGISIASVCGGWGVCKSCIVQFSKGNVPEPSEADQQFFSKHKITQGWRRACQCAPVSDCTIRVPARARSEAARAFSEGGDIWVRPDPIVFGHELKLSPPSLEDCVGDAERVYAGILGKADDGSITADIETLRALPGVVRSNDWQALAVVRENELIAIFPPKTRLLGVAVDLGTTNIALLLVDMKSGNTLASTGVENPQKIYGGDVIARLTEIKRDNAKLLEMQRMVAEAINEAIGTLCTKAKVEPSAIIDMVIAGNTAMNHIMAGLPTDHLGVAPFTATARTTADFKARDLGFDLASGAYVHLIPNIAGFVGGDHTAVLLGIRARTEKRNIIVIDIGTNTEISLIHNGRITSLSAPSGPALEGGNISHGMRAAQGAIEKISVVDGKLKVETIGDKPAVGLCGSGVLDALAALAELGAITHRGQINTQSELAFEEDGRTVLKLSEGEDHPITFSQEDVRNVQLAKGSIRGGIEVLLGGAGLRTDNLDRIVIAGAFGLYVNLDSAIAIGMLPDLPRDLYSQVGNAASMGAKLALVSGPLRQEGVLVSAQTNYIEQSGSKAFMACFMANINLPQNAKKQATST